MSSIAIREVRVSFEDYAYRAPMKFRATVVDRVTLLNVEVRVETAAGRVCERVRVHAARQRLVVSLRRFEF